MHSCCKNSAKCKSDSIVNDNQFKTNKNVPSSGTNSTTSNDRRLCKNIRPYVTVPSQKVQPKSSFVRRPLPVNVMKAERIKSPSEQVVHKQVFSNTGTVEVIVKTDMNKNCQSTETSKNFISQPWDQILKKKSDFNVEFSQFDPLRTIHFLAGELKSKLSRSFEDDPNIERLLENMERALERIPINVTTALSKEEVMKRHTADDIPEKDNPVKQQVFENKCIQTNISIEHDAREAKRLQKTLESNMKKLETMCQSLESACNSLRSERDNLQHLLSMEQNAVQILKDQITKQNYREQKYINTIKSMENEKDKLRKDLSDIKLNASLQLSQINKDSNVTSSELKNQNASLQKQCNEMQEELTRVRLQHEKFKVLVESKEKQLTELRRELKSLQSNIFEQINELRKVDVESIALVSSSPSSVTSDIMHEWPSVSKIVPNDHPRNTESPELIKSTSDYIHDLFKGIMRESSPKNSLIVQSPEQGDVVPQEENFKEMQADMSSRLMFDELFNRMSKDESELEEIG